MKKHLNRIKLKKLSIIGMSKVKGILKASKKALMLEKKRTGAHLRWLVDFKLRHKFDIRNKKLFKKYLLLTKKLRQFEIKHLRVLHPIRQ